MSDHDVMTAMEGVTPGLQKRSRERLRAFVAAGIRMLHDRGFDKLSINDLCAEVGVTVGSFYKRFSSKEAFIEFVQRTVAEETRQKWLRDLSSPKFRDASLDVFIGRVVSGVILWSRKYEGLTRASLRYAETDSALWTSTRNVGLDQAKLLTPLIVKIVERDFGSEAAASPAVVQAIQFAFQTMHATVQMMILSNPGPLTIHDDTAAPTLSKMMCFIIKEAIRDATEKSGEQPLGQAGQPA